MKNFLLEDVLKVIIDVSNIFYPTLTLPLQSGGNRIFFVSPLSRVGTKGGNNVMKITANHFSNNLLELQEKAEKISVLTAFIQSNPDARE
ncbi:hypothetical protein, partial [Scytonema sp. NUACC26]|uniref:hypothetical protein n=1 Tax=Scytonema sp. NUACC26 TaxID=3140176 RepID=UPI0038B3FAF4